MTVCVESERADAPPTLTTTTAPAGAWTEMVDAPVSCRSVRLKTSIPGYDELTLSAEVPVAQFVAGRAAKFDETAARFASAAKKEMGSESTCLKVPVFPVPENDPTYSPWPWARVIGLTEFVPPPRSMVTPPGAVTDPGDAATMMTAPPGPNRLFMVRSFATQGPRRGPAASTPHRVLGSPSGRT
jgi:hypothetical protein